MIESEEGERNVIDILNGLKSLNKRIKSWDEIGENAFDGRVEVQNGDFEEAK